MKRDAEFWLLVVFSAVPLLLTAFVVGDLSVSAATPEPVETCLHVAMADTIRIFYCEELNLYVNQLGFMAFEP